MGFFAFECSSHACGGRHCNVRPDAHLQPTETAISGGRIVSDAVFQLLIAHGLIQGGFDAGRSVLDECVAFTAAAVGFLVQFLSGFPFTLSQLGFPANLIFFFDRLLDTRELVCLCMWTLLLKSEIS